MSDKVLQVLGRYVQSFFWEGLVASASGTQVKIQIVKIYLHSPPVVVNALAVSIL